MDSSARQGCFSRTTWLPGDVHQNPIVKSQYGEATNPIFEVFYLEDAHGVIADFSGNPPYEF